MSDAVQKIWNVMFKFHDETIKTFKTAIPISYADLVKSIKKEDNIKQYLVIEDDCITKKET